MEGENFGTTGASLHCLGLCEIEVCMGRWKDQISLSVFDSTDMGLRLAIDEQIFSFVILLDLFSFLAIFFCNPYLKISRKLPPQYCLQKKMERDYSLWINITNFIGIFIQWRKQRNNRRLVVTREKILLRKVHGGSNNLKRII